MLFPKPFPSGGLLLRRVIAALAVLVAVALVAGLVARHADGGYRRPAQAATAAPSGASSPAPPSAATTTVVPSRPAAVGDPVAAPPSTGDPIVFAKAFASALWTYDTRTTSQSRQLAGLRSWLTSESTYADPAAVAAQVPDPTLWDRMRDHGQYATATVSEAHLPTAFNQAVAAEPTKLTVAYVYAVTVTGTQSIAWDGGGRGAEQRAVTLAVQCRPSRACALASIATAVYP